MQPGQDGQTRHKLKRIIAQPTQNCQPGQLSLFGAWSQLTTNLPWLSSGSSWLWLLRQNTPWLGIPGPRAPDLALVSGPWYYFLTFFSSVLLLAAPVLSSISTCDLTHLPAVWYPQLAQPPQLHQHPGTLLLCLSHEVSTEHLIWDRHSPPPPGKWFLWLQ